MKLKSVRLVGCGYRPKRYVNSEGYSDPTAGCAMGGGEIYGAPLLLRPGEKEKVIVREVPPVSQMEEYLAELAKRRKYRRKRH